MPCRQRVLGGDVAVGRDARAERACAARPARARPPRGGSCCGSGAPHVSSATRPARRTARRPITSATPSATSDFRRSAVPNAIEAETSTSSQVVSVRSGTWSRTWGWPVRALAAASRRRTSSPNWYGRICASSVPGAAARRPALARQRARDARRASTRSSASTSAPCIGPGPWRPGGSASERAHAAIGSVRCAGRARTPPTVSRMRSSRSSALHAVTQRVVGQDEPVAQHVGGEVGDVLGHGVVAAAQQRERLGGLDHADRPARRGAELDQALELVQPVLARVARGVGQRDGVGDHVAVDEDVARDLAVALERADRHALAHLGRLADRAADDRGLLADATGSRRSA